MTTFMGNQLTALQHQLSLRTHMGSSRRRRRHMIQKRELIYFTLTRRRAIRLLFSSGTVLVRAGDIQGLPGRVRNKSITMLEGVQVSHGINDFER